MEHINLYVRVQKYFRCCFIELKSVQVLPDCAQCVRPEKTQSKDA